MQLQDPLKVNQSNLDTENSLLPNNSTFNKNLPSSPMNINEGDDLSSHPMPILNSTASLIGKDINVSITSHVTQQNQSQIALACDAVENKRVELVPNMSAFIVQGNNQKTYSVQLFPKEKCNCPSTTTCWHIIASKLSLGIHNIIPGKKNINLSQLKRNSRTRVDKKSGRK